MTSNAENKKNEQERKKLPRYKEVYYRVMIRLLHWLVNDSFGESVVWVCVGGFYFIMYFMTLLFFGLDPDQTQWQHFVVGFICVMLFIYHWFFYLPKKLKKLANSYRQKLGREIFAYSPY